MRLNRVEALLKDHGFIRTGMGGNTLAYRREDGEVVEQINAEGLGRLTSERQTVLVWFHTLQMEEAGVVEEPQHEVPLGRVLACLAHPSDEYFALASRLDNGIGHVYGDGSNPKMGGR